MKCSKSVMSDPLTRDVCTTTTTDQLVAMINKIASLSEQKDDCFVHIWLQQSKFTQVMQLLLASSTYRPLSRRLSWLAFCDL